MTGAFPPQCGQSIGAIWIVGIEGITRSGYLYSAKQPSQVRQDRFKRAFPDCTLD
jgi:hypothetical protein